MKIKKENLCNKKQKNEKLKIFVNVIKKIK